MRVLKEQKKKKSESVEINLIVNNVGPRWYNSSKFFKSISSRRGLDVLIEEDVNNIISFSNSLMLEEEKRKSYIPKNITFESISSRMKDSFNILKLNDNIRWDRLSDIIFYGLLYLISTQREQKIIVSDIVPESRKEGYEEFRRIYSSLSVGFTPPRNKLDSNFWNIISSQLINYVNALIYREELFFSNLRAKNSIVLKDNASFYYLSMNSERILKKSGSLSFSVNPSMIFFRRKNPLVELYFQMFISSAVSRILTGGKKEKENSELNEYEKKLFLLTFMDELEGSLGLDKDYILLLPRDIKLDHINFEIFGLTIFSIKGPHTEFESFMSKLKDRIEETSLDIKELYKLNQSILKELSSL